MKANVGDRLLVHGKKVGSGDHAGEILEVRGAEGSPPYLVRYDDGHERLVVPGPDCTVEPLRPAGSGGDVAAVT